jgi:hypothetical protein
MDDAQRRKALNEAAFREVNERINELHNRAALIERDQPLEIVCECDRAACLGRFKVSVRVYERTRRDSARFFVHPGHEDPAVEDIIDTGAGYLIVRKRPGEPQEIADETDPRK